MNQPSDERRIQQLNRREWRWSVAYLILIGGVAATIGVGAPGWLIAGAVAVAVIVAGVVMIRDRITWDAILDYDERRFGLRTWRHKRKDNVDEYKKGER